MNTGTLQPQPLVDAVNAVLLNNETQVGYGDRVQTNAGAQSTGHWPMSSSRSQQQQQVSSQLLPNMVSSPVSVALCPTRNALMQSPMPLQTTSGHGRHSVEHTYQRHSPYPNPNTGLRPGTQSQSVMLHHGLSRALVFF